MPRINHQLILVSIYLFFLGHNSFGQTTEMSKPIFRFSLETGYFFPQNDDFKAYFKTNSTINTIGGLEIGSSNWKVLPSFKIGYTGFSTTLISLPDSAGVSTSNLFTTNNTQFSLGLVFPIHLKNNNRIRLRCAVVSNRTPSASLVKVANTNLLLSAGYQKILNKYFDLTASVTYFNHKISSNTIPTDWGGLSVNMGIGLNFGGN